MRIYKVIAFVLLLTTSVVAMAQKVPIENEDYNNSSIEMADAMRADGKIYVLVAIMLTIFAGFIIYAFRTEQKIKKLEKEVETEK